MIKAPNPTRIEWFELTPEPAIWHHKWNVTLANRICRRSILNFEFSRIWIVPVDARMRDVVNEGKVEVDEAYAMTTDLEQPILAVEIGGAVYPIDGWHRLRKAVKLSVRQIPFFVLTPEEDRRCRICSCCLRETQPSNNEFNQVVAQLLVDDAEQAALEEAM